MIILLSPAKKMRNHIDYVDAYSIPYFKKEAKQLSDYMKTLSLEALQKMFASSLRIAKQGYDAYQKLDVENADVPALLAYDGIQYSYMGSHVLSDEDFEYAQNHVRILSALYGALRPFDGIAPYRLEMNYVFHSSFANSLYEFWNRKIYDFLAQEDSLFIDLSSAEYGKCIQRYVDDKVHYIKVRFYEKINNQLKEKGVYVKMARGRMARYLVEHKADSIDDVISFQEMGYQYNEDLSSKNELVFVRENQDAK